VSEISIILKYCNKDTFKVTTEPESRMPESKS